MKNKAFSTFRALKLALEALEAVGAEFICRVTHHHKEDQHGGLDDCPNQARHEKAITAIKQALIVATPLAVPDKLTNSDGETPEYVNGWNDCRQLMMEMIRKESK